MVWCNSSYTFYTVLRVPVAAGEQCEYWEHWVSAAVWLLSSAPCLGHSTTDSLPCMASPQPLVSLSFEPLWVTWGCVCRFAVWGSGVVSRPTKKTCTPHPSITARHQSHPSPQESLLGAPCQGSGCRCQQTPPAMVTVLNSPIVGSVADPALRELQTVGTPVSPAPSGPECGWQSRDLALLTFCHSCTLQHVQRALSLCGFISLPSSLAAPYISHTCICFFCPFFTSETNPRWVPAGAASGNPRKYNCMQIRAP